MEYMEGAWGAHILFRVGIEHVRGFAVELDVDVGVGENAHREIRLGGIDHVESERKDKVPVLTSRMLMDGVGRGADPLPPAWLP